MPFLLICDTSRLELMDLMNDEDRERIWKREEVNGKGEGTERIKIWQEESHEGQGVFTFSVLDRRRVK